MHAQKSVQLVSVRFIALALQLLNFSRQRLLVLLKSLDLMAQLRGLSRFVYPGSGEDGQGRIAEGDRQNLAKFLTISRARLDNLVARLRSGAHA